MNHLIGLGKVFDKEELNIKILKCLDRNWQPKVTAISETRDLTTLTTTVLFGKLREHELEMNRLDEQEHREIKLKGIVLKSAAQKDESYDGCSISHSDTEILTLLTRKFSKFLKKKRKEKNQQGKMYPPIYRRTYSVDNT